MPSVNLLWDGSPSLRPADDGDNIGLTRSLVAGYTPSDVLPVSVAEFKTYAKVDSSADDDLIEEIIRAVTEQCQDIQRMTWFTTEMMLEWQRHGRLVALPYGPTQSVDLVRRWDGTEWTTLAEGTDYQVRGQDFKTLEFYAWGYGLEVTQTCGYGPDATDLPKNTKLAVYKACLSAYEDRQNLVAGTIIATIPESSRRLLGARKQIQI